MSNKIDMTGRVIGRLLVIEECGRDSRGEALWRCRCLGKTGDDCGNEVIVRGSSLRRELTTSCGCLRREVLADCNTKHGIRSKHPRLYRSIFNHFKAIRKGVRGYQNWRLDARYSDDAEGVVKFCRDLLSLLPEECATYEMSKTLDLDKDNGGNTFRPECVVFRPSSENRSKTVSNLKLKDGTRFVDFCNKVGVKSLESGRQSKRYNNYSQYFRTHNGEAHPELVEAANRTILEMRQCLELLRLLEDVRAFKAQLNT